MNLLRLREKPETRDKPEKDPVRWICKLIKIEGKAQNGVDAKEKKTGERSWKLIA